MKMNCRKVVHAINRAGTVTALLMVCLIAQSWAAELGANRVTWPWWFNEDGGNDLMREVSDSFDKTYPSFKGILALYPDDFASVGRFADRDNPIDVLVDRTMDQHGRSRMERRFSPGQPQPQKLFWGQQRLIVVASKDLRLERVSLLGVQWLLRKSEADWPPDKDEDRHRMSVRLICAPEKTWATRFMRRHFMEYQRKTAGVIEHSHYEFREDIKRIDGPDQILALVRKQPKCIGFVEYQPGLDFSGIDVLAVRDSWKDDLIKPKLTEVVQENYSFGDAIYLYLHPSAGPVASRFCRFAIEREGATLLEKHGFQTPYRQNQLGANARFEQLRSGQGVRLPAIGVGDTRGAFQGLATEYVRAKAAVQLFYTAADSDVSAIGAFVRLGAKVTTASSDSAMTDALPSTAPASVPTSASAVVPAISPFVKTGGVELLLLSTPPSGRALEVHGDKWNSLGRDKEGKPDGTGPVEHMIAGRAVAVVVNPLNKLQSLTLGQVQAIFGGEVNDWSLVSGAGLAAPGSPGTPGSPGSPGTPASPAFGKTLSGGPGAPGRAGEGMIKINCVGLQAGDPAAGVFHQEAVPTSRLRLGKACRNSAEALAEVSLDRQAIAFVDLTAIPASGQTVKVLAIQMGVGEKAKLVEPTAENIKNAMYPLSQRLYLYVHPMASDSAKDFAKFIATCGESEANPYVDTVKAVMETYQKHGLISLADAAQQRIAKDAAEAARTAPGSPTQAEKKKDVARPRVPIQ